MPEKLFAVVSVLVALGLLAACGGGDADPVAEPATQASGGRETTTQAAADGGGRAVMVQVAELNGSGQTGSATLTEVTGGTHVVVELRGGRPGPQSADIRRGTCERPAPKPEFRLQNLSGGVGKTQVRVPLQTLLSADYVIVVQRSTSESKAHVACAYLAAL